METDIFYRDEEGRLVQVLSQAVMRESGRDVVLYQELFGSYGRKVEYRDVFLASMNAFDGMFSQDEGSVVSNQAKASGEKTAFGTGEAAKPGGTSEESVFLGTERAMDMGKTTDAKRADGMGEDSPQELLIAFLDAQAYSEKLEILYQMKDCVTDYLIDTMALSLDMEIPQGVLEDRYQKLIRSLRTVMKYEANRLR